jgi:glycosyltransferase involved in cell wall biosynthesis
MKPTLAEKHIRVAVDLTPLLPGGANGGVKPAILQFIRGLQRLQDPSFDFCFITAAASHAEIQAIVTERDKAICLDSPPLHGSLNSHFFRKKRVDLLYAPFGMVRFPNCSTPIISMVVDLLHRDYPYSMPEAERQWRESYFAKMALCADRFQVISDYTGERLTHHYGVSDEKVFRTYLPIEGRLKIEPDVVQPGKRYFFYPANFWPHKNHEVLLIAYQMYRYHAGATAWDLVLTGRVDSRQPILRELATNLGVEDQVLFKGYVSEKELAQLFSGASALVFPSLHEGFGIPLLEAMNLGVPVLASDVGSLREVAGEAALLVDARKPQELAAAMRRLAGSEELRADLRRRGLERAKLFSFDAEVARLAEKFIQTAAISKKRTWEQRLRQQFALLRSDQLIRSRTAASRLYRFLRDRV